MEVLKYQLNDNYQACHIKVGENPLFFNSTLSLVYHAMPGNALLSRTIINVNLTLQKFKMPSKELSEIENSIYTGTLEFYIESKENQKRFKTRSRTLFLNGVFVEQVIYLRIQNRLGIKYKNQIDNPLTKIADKLVMYIIPLFKYFIDQGNDYPNEFLKQDEDYLLRALNEAKSNPKYI